MNTPYHLTPEARAQLGAHAAKIRANLQRRREARESPHVRAVVAAATLIVHTATTPFLVDGKPL